MQPSAYMSVPLEQQQQRHQQCRKEQVGIYHTAAQCSLLHFLPSLLFLVPYCYKHTGCVHADDWNLVPDCLAAARQPQQDEACGTGPRAGHSYGGLVARNCPIQALHVRTRYPPCGGELQMHWSAARSASDVHVACGIAIITTGRPANATC